MFGRLILAFCFAFVLCENAHSSDLYSQRSDTFISEEKPNEEFSKSPYLKISSRKGFKSLTYLPFYIDITDIGYQPERDEIMCATLVLKYKKVEIKSQYHKENKKQLKNITEQVKKAVVKEIENEKISEFKVYAVIDSETFIPNSEDSIISWNGKKNAPAPKHNNIDDELYDDGIYQIAEFTIDFSKDDMEDGEEIQILSDNLASFLNFAFGTSKIKNMQMSFRSSLEKIERICLIIRQTAGDIPLTIYSADFSAEAKPESGDDTKKATDKNQQQSSSIDQSQQTLLSIPNSPKPQPSIEEDRETEPEKIDYRPKINFEFRGS